LANITLDELLVSSRTLLVRGLVLMNFAGALAFLASSGSKRRETTLPIPALLGVPDLAWVTHDAQPTIDAPCHLNPPALASVLTSSDGSASPRFYSLGESRIPLRFERSYGDAYWEWDKEGLRPNLATVFGLEQLHNYDPGKLVWMNRVEAELVY